MSLLLLVLILILLFGGGFGFCSGRIGYGPGGLIGLLVLVLIIALVMERV